MKQNILVIGPSWIGDMVMAQCLFQSIKRKWPAVNIDVFAPEYMRDLIACMPECRLFHVNRLAHKKLGLIARYRIGKQFQNQYDETYVLPNSFKSALVAYWARIPKRIGWRGEWRDLLLTHTYKAPLQNYPLMVQRYVALVDEQAGSYPEQAFRPHLKADQTGKDRFLNRFHITDINLPILAICPGAAFGPSKQWLTSRFKQVVQHFQSKKWQVWILGGGADIEICKEIASGFRENVVNLAGNTRLGEAIMALSISTCVLTHDSGLMHIACGLNKPCVVLYGSSSPAFTPPLSDKAVILRHNVGCNPCFKRDCFQKQHYCMQAISTREVIQAISMVCQ